MWPSRAASTLQPETLRKGRSFLAGCFQPRQTRNSPRRCKAGAATPPPSLPGEGGMTAPEGPTRAHLPEDSYGRGPRDDPAHRAPQIRGQTAEGALPPGAACRSLVPGPGMEPSPSSESAKS
ncbi:uncharacterized protein LOC133094044 isoform X2 [Eubalaena glacialis]|uniref:uncharacterized protein LOC133094044 isoform X2 n=1 Tax=Eubalaena glacialis TaxID=27606 RepID=UPI002A5ADC90|nr:uncharacterized protein LOC133094044 isoform X2 [Eubalaena glacialis]